MQWAVREPIVDSMTEHPNAIRYRRAFEALWERGDQSVLDAMCRPDAEWINDIGAGPWRELRTPEAIAEFLAGWYQLFDGGFRHELIDVCASDRSIVAILREVGLARGHTFDNLALYRYSLDADGLITHLRTYDQDREHIESFWAAIGPVGVSSAESPAG
jgi:ketosteroid isomerase-like protein